jgi:isoaspartyl peptidase/L-asparaginase-like protein (Ntn-hydrolase superfamily)
MEAGLSPQEAADKVIYSATRAIIDAGYHCDCMAIVCMNGKGEIGASCNHQGFTYTYAFEGQEPTSVVVTPIIDIGGIPNETKHTC